MIQGLLSEYRQKRSKIKDRIRGFEAVWGRSDKEIFGELCFCICTPQSKAIYCDKAITGLRRKGTLFKGDLRQLRKGLKAIRFPNNKARYIKEARRFFTAGGSIRIKDRIDPAKNPDTRQWLVRNVKGIGLKEASHFLRNIGLGRDMAILDVHILRNLERYGVIKEIPASISRKTYLDIEGRMREFSRKVKIPLEELDLLFWSNQTGFIFK